MHEHQKSKLIPILKVVATLALMAANTGGEEFELGNETNKWGGCPTNVEFRQDVCDAKVARKRTGWATVGSGNQVNWVFQLFKIA